ncbi:uncharacterized protein LOC124144183 [Haliotis rufescens]|uniref:uncharacterized protein LOC124144183 n=1 Tax=Haliotis rufescens TaxID=6454 RepID=UPI00201F546C|nr:uncharacterized protein LOC124144183 [Haliotis rufescens]
MPLDGCCVHHRGIGEQSQQVTDRLIQYDRLLRRCQEMATSSGKEDSVWTKLPEFRCLLQSLDHLPDPPPPIMDPPDPPPIMDSPDPLPPPIMDPPSSDIHPPTIDLSKAIADVTKCFMPVQGKPCSPKLLPHECVVDQRSVSLTWTYDPSDHIGYFTVYYETAIFTNGLCSNMTSVTVTDFGPSFGHVTLHDLDPETRYKISVTASNEFGESSPTEHLYCRTSATKTELCLL